MKNVVQLKSRARPFAHAGAALLMSAAFTASAAGPLPKEAGVWIDDTGKGAVKIEPCGAKLCGRIFWLKDLVNAKGEVLIDRYNPDQSQRSRTICGLPVLGQLAPMPEGGYDGGWVYDPKVGSSYSVAIALNGPDQLSVTGYKGVKFLGKTFTWTRAKTELPNCAAAAVETKAEPKSAPAAAVGAAAAKASTA
ncbi:MAG: DUF2147 domain-containing protein, partial [Hyphomicrobium sp.]